MRGGEHNRVIISRHLSEEDAALIVKAVNAHDGLLAACELASEQEECVCEDKGVPTLPTPVEDGGAGDGECLGCILSAAVKAAKG